MDTLVSLHRKIDRATELKSIVRTMKAMAASNIGQYETAVAALKEYYQTVSLGIVAYLTETKVELTIENKFPVKHNEKSICAIVFGSDQGLVGQFNDSLADFVSNSLKALPGKKEIWAIGERIQSLLADEGFTITNLFSVPNSVTAITPLVGQILVNSEEAEEKENIHEFYIFHNRPKTKTGYEAVSQRLLPLDKKWSEEFASSKWPTNKKPQIAGGAKPTLRALIREYLFASMFRACAESLASENSSRLNAMQRAEKNIEELLDDLGHKFHNLRQSSIDEELFDIVAGFEALKDNGHKKKVE